MDSNQTRFIARAGEAPPPFNLPPVPATPPARRAIMPIMAKRHPHRAGEGVTGGNAPSTVRIWALEIAR